MNRSRAFVSLHLAVALFGLAGLFGRWINLSPLMIVWGRVAFASLAFLPILLFRKRKFELPKLIFLRHSAILGLVLAFHWFSFFKAIQETSIALALLSFASFPLFTLLLEAMVDKMPLSRLDGLLVSLSFLGTAFIVPWDFNAPDLNGVIWGLLSGLSFAVLAILNRKLVKDYNAVEIAFYQDLLACVALSPFIMSSISMVTTQDWQLLLVLGTIFTALSHALFIASLKWIQAKTAALIAALEPVYGIVAGVFLFYEIPEMKTILGGLLILSAGLWAQGRSRTIA